jgi:squalene-hopene/tetraprenyl-beta-curcumene cyclase
MTNLHEPTTKAISLLKSHRTASGHWEGQLSTSALSTATAIMAMELVGRTTKDPRFPDLINGGLSWLAEHQNENGGWGDTVKSVSNISTTMLAHAVFVATEREADFPNVVAKAKQHIDEVGGVDAVLKRYGDDHTFSIPILTHCALAGIVDWKHVIPLPFELAWVPARFYKTVQLPVVSYALPALIAIGQVIFKHRKSWNPFTKLTRMLARKPTLKVLERIQPTNGGFLEATPLTSFVTMSLAGCGLAEHAVAKKGIEFIVGSVRPDGSWPIDTNLATWVTTLSVNAIGAHLSEDEREPIREWLLRQQYTEVHPYTNADPGGWSWTDLPGGVPDADDTPGAMLALLKLSDNQPSPREQESLLLGMKWLLSLQNRDGGWPTFCRGWGKLPFDRSSPDISAHVIRALAAVRDVLKVPSDANISKAIERGFRFLDSVQRDDGSWLPLWFGNQFAPDDENPLYGTAKVLAAYHACGFVQTPAAKRGFHWLATNQNEDGGWGGIKGTPSTVEETGLAVETLLDGNTDPNTVAGGLEWLTASVRSGKVNNTAPIGFYFAKLWYFEDLYPLIFAASAMNKAVQCGHQTST